MEVKRGKSARANEEGGALGSDEAELSPLRFSGVLELKALRCGLPWHSRKNDLSPLWDMGVPG